MTKVLSYLSPYRIAIVIALSLMLIELTLELLQPLFMAKIIDEGILQRDLSVVVKWGGIMIGFSFLAFAAGIINSFYSAHVSQSYGYDIRKHLFEKIQSFSFANFNKFPTSSLITRITNDVTQTQNAIFMSLRIMLRAPLIIIGGVIMALFVNVKLGLVILVTVPIITLFIVWVMKKGWGLFQSVQEKLDGVNSVMRESLIRMRLIRAFNTDGYESALFKNASGELRDRTIFVLRFMELTMPILLILMNVSILAVLWFGSGAVISGNVKEGEVVAIINYATRITGALSIFTFITLVFTRARASANRISEVLDFEEEEIAEGKRDSRLISGKLEFENVSFTYPDAEESVLHQVSFQAEPGEKIAILGETGSGKSSLFQLIPRLYDVTEGVITVDGHDIRHLKEEVVRNQMGYVSQVPYLFTGTIKENIAWGKEGASMDEIMEAAIDAQIYETIETLPHQFDTVLGQKGVNLSGGQKQRLSIARALIRKPKILLLDDSTSALDLKTESKLLEALKRYKCTTLIITQKISTALTADKILILSEGKLIAEGSHEKLIKENDLYQQMYYSQYGKEDVHHA